MLNFWRQKNVPTCSCACLRQHRNPAGPKQHHCFSAITQARLKINYHWADVLALSPSTGGGVLLHLTRRGTDSGTLSLGLDMSSLFRVYTHTHTLTGVEDKARGSKQKWHPIHLSWSGSDVPHLILQGLALWNDIGPVPEKTNAVASIPEAGSLCTAHTQRPSAVCLQLNTVLWLNAAIQYHFTAVNVPKRSLSVIAKNTPDKSSLIDVKCEAELVK